MWTISFSRSLLEFNKRVLYAGNIEPDKTYIIEELDDKLFYNKIFISNTKEMFEKYDMHSLLDGYECLLKKYEVNMAAICNALNRLDKSIVTDQDSFERRLQIRKSIKDIVISKHFDSLFDLASNIDKSLTDKSAIYYITINQDSSMVSLSYIDPMMSIYNTILHCDFQGYTMYWKTDDTIISYLNNLHNGITFAFVCQCNEAGNVTKIEFNAGDTDNEIKELCMNTLSCLFPDSIIFQNRYLYSDDIERIIKSKIKVEKTQHQKYSPINFNSIFKKDMMIEYPKDSFDQYLRLLDSAAKNKAVKSIYITLYRIGDDPAIYYILKEAIDNGKKVYANIELYASGEYDRNTMWMNELKQIGVKVSMYMAGKVKVHAKLTLIKFNNRRMIAQIGTGNYHTKTTSQYTDLSLLTAKPEICRQVNNVFNILFERENITEITPDLLITRYNFREEIIKCINVEATRGSNGYICIKCNSLQDQKIINALADAGSRGCKIILIVRGVCTWIPAGLGKNVKVKSIIWDKLEHSRVYCFGNFNPRIYLGSLDPITNKIEKRIETLVFVKDPDMIMKVCRYLNKYIVNTKESWELTESGIYVKL